MSGTNSTSTGHEASDAQWLDTHFESSRPEYEDALRQVGIKPGWAILDAGCGGGSFLPLICSLAGPAGRVDALDLAPENIQRARAVIERMESITPVRTQVGSVLSLPFDAATLDCVWSANVVQYLSEVELRQAVAEARRVLKPGAVLAIKEFDSTLLQILPIDASVFARFMAKRLNTFRERGVLGTDSGSTLPARLRQLGLDIVRRKGFLVERWGPAGGHTRSYVRDLILYFARVAPKYDLPDDDLRYWERLAEQPERLIDQPDFCYREFFVLTLCRAA